jgi:hypothetical protein
MKRIVARLLAVGLLAGLMLAPTLAFAEVLPPAPADGQKVALYAYTSEVYEYPAGSGAWYLDYFVSNYPSNYYSDGANIVDPMTSIEYLNAADAVVGVETFGVPANVMLFAWQPTDTYPGNEYYRTVHHRLTPPAGAVPSKTRMAVEVPPTDPDYPKYHYGIAARAAVPGSLDRSPGPVDAVTLGGGRTQFTLTVTNSTDVTVGPVQVQGSEGWGPSSSNVYFLNGYDVVANDPAKALRLGVGESTTFTVRGLRPTPDTFLRFAVNLWAEAEPTDLYGTVTFRGAPLAGASVTVDGYSPRTTISNGGYAMSGVVPGSHLVIFSKPGFMDSGIMVTTAPGSQISQDVAMSTYPSLTRSPSQSTKTYTRKHGKVTYTLSATVKGIGAVPVGGVRVYLQRSTNGRTGWKNSGAALSSSAIGRVAKTFTSTKRSTYYYRWSVPAQTGVLATPHTSTQKIVVK